MDLGPSFKTDPHFYDFDLNHKYLFFRRTKIVATIGPASSSPKILRQLFEKGLDVARINFSHGTFPQHASTIRCIRKISKEQSKSVAIIGDLCGPKIRVGEFPNGSVVLKDKSIVTITTKQVLGSDVLIPSQYKDIVKDAMVGHSILLDDGNLELSVLQKKGNTLQARVVHGGVLKNHKGMNLPQTELSAAALTQKDKEDVLFCIQNNVDYIALSFVRKAADIKGLKSFLAHHGSDIPVIAKIEMPQALTNICSIVEESDAIMVARGDLGVELPAKKVPVIQSKLIRIANSMNKPVIVATQMLESMISNARPTRAEVTDVASACLEGADAVMMSAETASGKFPVEALETMDSILRETEAFQFFSKGGRFCDNQRECTNELYDAIGESAAQLSRDLMARSVFVLTESGYTARMVSADRPAAPIIALTYSKTIARRMCLYWGVYPRFVAKPMSTPGILAYCERILRDLKLAKKKDYVILITEIRDITVKTVAIMVHTIAEA